MLEFSVVVAGQVFTHAEHEQLPVKRILFFEQVKLGQHIEGSSSDPSAQFNHPSHLVPKGVHPLYPSVQVNSLEAQTR